ncbi:hypothetical protein C9J48_04015 [Photobacterium profundum]|uniref:Uncharacterized protein n=1 Tax=Photobacterium profundum 3TCK TaxID=314280 RepID=Q1Z7E8_9GAMM|nr:hypothetical protein [Photobacterium profundum]EAS44511.1 hypothetical protein P3TCK_15180 [Photobacterium profundum 3TCK]PSV64625.1 hypothetical protein C9J48_04015 [Photobacterium profundum]
MKSKLTFLASSLFMVLLLSSPVSASSSGGNGGGFGQTYCKLPSGETVFVPWFNCRTLGGKGNPADF